MCSYTWQGARALIMRLSASGDNPNLVMINSSSCLDRLNIKMIKISVFKTDLVFVVSDKINIKSNNQ